METVVKKSLAIGTAVEFLEGRLKKIDSVKEWAKQMGYSNPNHFSDRILCHFGFRPKTIMDGVKLRKAFQLLTSKPSIDCYTVANEIGKRDEHALYRFIKRLTNFYPRYFKSLSRLTEKTNSENGQ